MVAAGVVDFAAVADAAVRVLLLPLTPLQIP